MMSTFIVRQPTTTGKDWAKWIGARIFFPPIVLWDVTKYLANYLLGVGIGKLLILPAGHPRHRPRFTAQRRTVERLLKAQGDKSRNSETTLVQHTITTHDNAELSTLEIHSNKDQKAAENRKFIINFNGNCEFYEGQLQNMQADAMRLNCTVIGFNYRGVGNSTGSAKSSQDLVTDGIAQVQRLLDQNVEAENIFLNGYSIGAGVATFVAKHFHDRGHKIYLFNNRSFSSLTNIAVGWVRKSSNNGYEESLFSKALGWIAWPLIRLGTALLKWEIDAATAFKALPDSHKEYIVVRSSKRSRVNEHPADDTIIPHWASLHQALKPERHQAKEKLKRAERVLDELADTNDLLKTELIQARGEISEARMKLNSRKMVTSDLRQQGHTAPLSTLTSRYQQQSAKAFFDNFFTGSRKTQHEDYEEVSFYSGREHKR